MKLRQAAVWMFMAILVFGLFVFAMVNGGFIPWFLLYLTVFLVLYEAFTVFFTLRDLNVTRTLEAHRRTAGQSIAVRVKAVRRSFWPVLWIRFQESIPQTLLFHQSHKIDALAPLWQSTFHFEYTLHDLPRGVHTLANAQFVSGDIFGLFRLSHTIAQKDSILVYPKIVQVAGWSGRVPEDYGHRQATRKRAEESSNVLGVRDYVAGDRLSRIHWPASARTGSLKAKEFELHVTNEMLFVPDVSRYSFNAATTNLFELEMTMTASLLKYAYDLRRRFGLTVLGKQVDAQSPGTGQALYFKLMESLAQAMPDADVPFSDAVRRLAQEAPLGTMFVILSPTLDQAALLAASALCTKGSVEWFVPMSSLHLSDEMRLIAERFQMLGVAIHFIHHPRQLAELNRGGGARVVVRP